MLSSAAVRLATRGAARSFLSGGVSARRAVNTSAPPRPKREEVTVTFVMADGTKQAAKGKVGQNLLDIIVENNVDIDGFGACEGTLACSTCHLVFKKVDFDRIPDSATDEEMDMLDLAYGLTDTSRLGCQVCMTKDLDGLEATVPAGINDQRI